MYIYIYIYLSLTTTPSLLSKIRVQDLFQGLGCPGTLLLIRNNR